MIIVRDEWGAKGPLPRKRMDLPARAFVLHHTVTPVTPHPYEDMLSVEKIGVARFGHISYSYVIHPDGTIMEGCGLRAGAHTAGRNSSTFGVALIGDYNLRNPTVWQVDAVRWLAATLVGVEVLRPGIYPSGGHRDYAATACPGEKAYRVLDMMRIPWSDQPAAKGTVTMADDPNLPNMAGPITYTFVIAADGTVRGYYAWSATSGELHAFGDVPYHGRSEVPR